MTRNVNLNASDWCDLVFEGKNKAYGAYEMRQTSSRRHITAFIIVVFFTGVVASIPSLMDAVKIDDLNLGGTTEVMVISDLTPLEEQVPEENVVKQELAPPPLKLKETIRYTPPVITTDENVQEGEEMRSQDELNENRDAQISRFTVEGSTDADAISLEDLNDNKVIIQDTEETPHVAVQQMPQFPGGNGELMKYISSNLRYPSIAAENDIEGRVFLRFVVGKDGAVSNVIVQKGFDTSCDKEAVRVISSMPNWIPGMQNGRAVPVYFTLPIVFKLAR